MSFMDQKPRSVTEKDLEFWKLHRNRFCCYLCGKKFQLGDYWRFVYAVNIGLFNFLVCDKCDGEDVLEKWKMANKEAEERFWWLWG